MENSLMIVELQLWLGMLKVGIQVQGLDILFVCFASWSLGVQGDIGRRFERPKRTIEEADR
jgi:hypothetical protein